MKIHGEEYSINRYNEQDNLSYIIALVNIRQMVSVALQSIKRYNYENIVSLSIFDGEYVMYNFFWPEYISHLEQACLEKEETRKLYNVHHMKNQRNTKQYCTEVKATITVDSFLNENKYVIRKFLINLINTSCLIIHKYDVVRWLSIEFLRTIKLHRVKIVDARHTLTSFCNNNTEHNTMFCTKCKCINVWQWRNENPSVYNGGISFEYFVYSAYLISNDFYRYLQRKRLSDANRNTSTSYGTDTQHSQNVALGHIDSNDFKPSRNDPPSHPR